MNKEVESLNEATKPKLGIFVVIKRFFCKHDWEQIDKTPEPINDGDGWMCCSRLHKCRKCGKEQMLGSGWY